MYSVVLLMALSGGEAPAAWGHHDSCSGCTGYVSCCGCCGGSVAACCGGGTGYSACCGGCTGDCHGSKHSFFSKFRHGHSCCGGCDGGVISYTVCSGCCGGYCGGTVMVPAAPPVKETLKTELAPLPKGTTEEVRSPATFVTAPPPAFEAPLAADSTEPRSFGSRLLNRLRGTSAP